MSIFKKPKSGIYHYAFNLKRHRYYGSTGVKDKVAAQRIHDDIREKALVSLSIGENQDTTTIHEACALWYAQRGQFNKNHKVTKTHLKWIVRDIGKNTRMRDITNRQLQNIIAQWRVGRKNGTVNRHFTELLRAVWRYSTPDIKQPNWTLLTLQEPRERVREIMEYEEKLIRQNLRPDMLPVFAFSLETGLRKSEALNLKWTEIDFNANVIIVNGKGGKIAPIPLTNTAKAILGNCKHHPVYIFTFKSQKASHGRRMGERIPLTATALQKPWWQCLKDSGIEDLVWHDIRHTTATRLLRRTGNLALVQQLLRHSDIATTRKYAHTTIEDLRTAMESGVQAETHEEKRA